MRHYADWLQAYIKYTSISEAPTYMHFWSGVSAIAGALQRKVWFDMGHFSWYPNFYIIMVAPPGIVSKSTTVGIAIRLLRKVPGIKFGPDIVTWPDLVTKFAEAREAFEFNEAWHEMCSITLESSEFGNLFDPRDRKMVDLFVHLWDGKPGEFVKSTKTNGADQIVNPWINLIACTTPAWIADNFPEYMIGGGFTSRCVFVYAEEKSRLVAYPFLEMPSADFIEEEGAKLVDDLTEISQLKGSFRISGEALNWGQKWYELHWKHKPIGIDSSRFGGYLSRKQSHLHKLAMILSASCSNDLIITKEHLEIANDMVTDLEKDMHKVFSKIGKSQVSANVDRLLEFIQQKGQIPYKEAFQYVHAQFPSARDFEDVIVGCIKSGQLELKAINNIPTLIYTAH